MLQIFDFLKSNWETISLVVGNAITMSGWLGERKKRMRDNRDSDVQFWEKTIDRQNSEISKLEVKIQLLQSTYETQINNLLQQVSELSDRLAQYEPVVRKKNSSSKSETNA